MRSSLLLALLPATWFLPLFGHPVADLASQQPHGQTRPKPKPKPKPRAPNYGAKADSLAGIPGHRFGEPRSSFPELEQRGFADPEGYVSYSAVADKELGWFGKNNKNNEQVSTTYWFYQDKFAAFTAMTKGSVSRRQLLADETLYLFGKGLSKEVAFGEATTRWEGKKVLVVYLDGHNEVHLSVASQAILAQMAADKLAKQKADAAARAAKFRADNVPTGH